MKYYGVRIKTGKLTKNLSILNTYAPGSNYEFNEIKEHRGEVNKYITNQPKNLINCWRTDNNGQPLQNENNKMSSGTGHSAKIHQTLMVYTYTKHAN